MRPPAKKTVKTPAAKKTAVKTTRVKKTVIDDVGPNIKQFTCNNCKNKFFDMNHYFTGKASKRCFWCIRNPTRIKGKK
jgi:hypothetical protein